MAEWKGGFLNSLKSGVHGSSCGAAAGRSSTPTATVRVRAVDQLDPWQLYEMLTGNQDTGGSNPSKPRNLVQSPDTGEEKRADCCDSREYRTASTMCRDGIQSDRGTDQT